MFDLTLLNKRTRQYKVIKCNTEINTESFPFCVLVYTLNYVSLKFYQKVFITSGELIQSSVLNKTMKPFLSLSTTRKEYLDKKFVLYAFIFHWLLASQQEIYLFTSVHAHLQFLLHIIGSTKCQCHVSPICYIVMTWFSIVCFCAFEAEQQTWVYVKQLQYMHIKYKTM